MRDSGVRSSCDALLHKAVLACSSSLMFNFPRSGRGDAPPDPDGEHLDEVSIRAVGNEIVVEPCQEEARHRFGPGDSRRHDRPWQQGTGRIVRDQEPVLDQPCAGTRRDELSEQGR
jgi:hypothetical protein